MITTSYFASKLIKGRKLRLVSISRVTRYCKCERFSLLAPTREVINLAHEGKFDDYIHLYNRDILSKLDPIKVYKELDGSVLLCWEKSGAFCHRRLVADWLQNAAGQEVPELNYETAVAFELLTALQKIHKVSR